MTHLGGNTDEEHAKILAAQEKCVELLHAVQTGVAYIASHGAQDDTNQTSPKHLRTGVNSALIQNSSLAIVLIRNGVINELEYWETQVELWEKEVASYQAILSESLGTSVKLR